MKRATLLQSGLTEEKNVQSVVATTVAKDQKFIKREKRNLEDSIEDDEEQLSQRLQSELPVDKSTIEVLYKGIQEKKERLELYKAFETEFFTQNNG